MVILYQRLPHPFETLPCKPAAETPLLVQVSDGTILVCGSAVLKFRAGTSSKAILARARDKWGPGMSTDNEGYKVTCLGVRPIRVPACFSK